MMTRHLTLFALVTVMLITAFSAAAAEQTLSIIKPDAVRNGNVGAIIDRFEKAGFTVAAAKMTRLSEEEAAEFYAVHKQRPFYDDLVNFMTSGPIVAMILEGDDALARNRELMGATDPSNAAANTLRREFGSSIQLNAVHGSDGPATAINEVRFFFG